MHPFDFDFRKLTIGLISGLIAMAAFVVSPKAAEPSHAGCWIGADAGYQIKTSEFSTGFGNVELSADNATYGPSAGCDVPIKGSPFVVGLMGSWTFTNAKSAITEVQSEWSVVARVGYLVTPATMPYILAGYTQLDEKLPTALAAFKDNPRGLTLGGGIEHMLNENLALSLEGRWVDLGHDTVLGVTKDDNTFQGLLRLSWKFGGVNPVKYFIDDEPPAATKPVCDKKLANCK